MPKLATVRDLTIIGGIVAAAAAYAVDMFDLGVPGAPRFSARPVAPRAPYGWLRLASSGYPQRPATIDELQASTEARERNGGSGLFARVGFLSDREYVYEDDPRYPDGSTAYFVTVEAA